MGIMLLGWVVGFAGAVIGGIIATIVAGGILERRHRKRDRLERAARPLVEAATAVIAAIQAGDKLPAHATDPFEGRIQYGFASLQAVLDQDALLGLAKRLDAAKHTDGWIDQQEALRRWRELRDWAASLADL